MAEVLVQFDDAVVGPDGRSYTPRACGTEVEGMWQGWVEFTLVGNGETHRTTRETTQPNRTDLLYWAEGLTHVYLEGALRRALDPQPMSAAREREVDARPAYERPAAELSSRRSPEPPSRGRAILDPFAVYAQGERVLRQELGALDLGHLRDIARFHALLERQTVEGMREPALIDAIVEATAEIFERAHSSTGSGTGARPAGPRADSRPD
jgi:hypothetical protein